MLQDVYFEIHFRLTIIIYWIKTIDADSVEYPISTIDIILYFAMLTSWYLK